jgi:regulatory protein
VRRRLLRGGAFSGEVIETTLARLREHGLLDDRAFASYWLEQRRTFRPRGARLLRAELRQHGISSDVAAETTAALATSDDDAYRAARKRAEQLAAAGADERTFLTRVSQLLTRRGFDWATIAPVVERLWNELGETLSS